MILLSRDWQGLWEFVVNEKKPPEISDERYADYVVLDMKRPWFIIDRGCEWLYGACQDGEMAATFLRLVSEARLNYSVAFESDGFMILKRVSEGVVDTDACI